MPIPFSSSETQSLTVWSGLFYSHGIGLRVPAFLYPEICIMPAEKRAIAELSQTAENRANPVSVLHTFDFMRTYGTSIIQKDGWLLFTATCLPAKAQDKSVIWSVSEPMWHHYQAAIMMKPCIANFR